MLVLGRLTRSFKFHTVLLLVPAVLVSMGLLLVVLKSYASAIEECPFPVPQRLTRLAADFKTTEKNLNELMRMR